METEKPGDTKLIAAGKAEAQRRELQRARTIAIVFGVTTGLSLICLVYAFVQQGIAKENVKAAHALQIKLQECEKEATRQRDITEKIVAETAKKKLNEGAIKKIKK